MVLLQPLVLKNISPLIFKELLFGNISIASPLFNLELQNMFHIGSTYICSYYNLNFWEIYVFLFFRIFYLATISIASPFFTLELHKGRASIWSYYNLVKNPCALNAALINETNWKQADMELKLWFWKKYKGNRNSVFIFIIEDASVLIC